MFDGKILKENRIDIGTTFNEVELNITIKNDSNVLLKDMIFIFPEGIIIIKPLKMPTRMNPKQEIKIKANIDTSISKAFTMEVEGHFLHVVAR